MTDKSQYIVMQCLDAFKDAHGNPGQHKEPVAGFDMPMNKTDALAALKSIEAQRPGEDFSLRRIAPVIQFEPKQL